MRRRKRFLLTFVVGVLGVWFSVSPLFSVSDSRFFSSADSNPYSVFQNIRLPFDATQVNTFFQDNRGVTWIGTSRGLFYYDGYTTHRVVNAEGNHSDYITVILQPEDKYLCIGTTKGVFLFNLLTEQYETLQPEMGNIELVSTMVLFDNKLWIGTEKDGISTYNFDKRLLQQAFPEDDERSRFIHVLKPSNDKLYIGSYKGLSVYDPISGVKEEIPFPTSKNHSMITSLLWDKDENCIWVGTENNFYRCSKANRAMEEFPLPVSTPIESLEQDNRHHLIIGTGNGLYIYNKESKRIRHFTHASRNGQSLCNNLVRCSYRDKYGNTWIGTDNGVSLSQYNPTYQLIHISELTGSDEGNRFSVIYKDSRDNYWMGGKNGLLMKMSGAAVRWYHTGDKSYPLKHNHIRNIYEDRSQNIWIATDGGIARYDAQSGQFIFYTIVDKTRQKSARWAYDILEDDRGRLWVATHTGGLFVIDKTELMEHDTSNGDVVGRSLSVEANFSNSFFQLLADKDGNFWGNSEEGLVTINPLTETFTLQHAWMDRMVYDGNECLWMARGKELYRFNRVSGKDEKIYELPEENGKIHSLVIAENLIGFSSIEGISYLNRGTCEVQHFNLSESNFGSGFYEASQNRILWGGNDAILNFPFRSLYQKSRNISTLVQIMAVYAGNKRLLPGKDYEGIAVRYRDNITLPYTLRDIQVEVSDLPYASGHANNIYYRLNQSESWEKLSAGQNKITFTNLTYGNHSLEVWSGTSSDSELAPLTFFIRILPPWYASGIAYAIYILLLLIIIFFSVKAIRTHLKRKYEEMEQNLDLSNMKMDFFMYISRELKGPLDLIITPVSRLIEDAKKEEQRQQLKLIYKNAIRLNTLIHKLLDIKRLDYEDGSTLLKSKVELCSLTKSLLDCFSTSFEEKQIEVSFLSDRPRIWAEIDTLKIENVLLNLFSTMDKHAAGHGGEIEVRLEQHEGEVLIQLSDKGSSLLEEEHACGFARLFFFPKKVKKVEEYIPGLRTMEKNIRLHGGSMEIRYIGENGGECKFQIRIILPGNSHIDIFPSNDFRPSTVSRETACPVLLIVNDNVEFLTFLANTFRENYTCLTALTGKEGLELAKQQLPDIIIVDLCGALSMSGLEFCKFLKHYQPTTAIPLVMLSEESDKESELESIKAGVDMLLPKPYEISNLRLRLQQLLQARRSLEKKIRIEHISQPTEEVVLIRDSDEIFLSHITAVIDEHLENTEFNVSMLSTLSRTDKKRLCQRIKQLTGNTPVEYIRQIRIKKAAILLAQKKLSVSEVMYKVGFSNASYFSKCFIAEFKVTPTQYMTDRD